MAFRSVVLALAVNLVCADFVYDDKLGAGKSPVLPLGSADRFLRSAYEITRTTTGALGIVGGQHSQLILDFGDQETQGVFGVFVNHCVNKGWRATIEP